MEETHDEDTGGMTDVYLDKMQMKHGFHYVRFLMFKVRTK